MNYMTYLAYQYGITQEHAFRYLAYVLLGIVLSYVFPALRDEYSKGLQWDKINYRFYLRYQIKNYGLFFLPGAAAHGIILHFATGNPIVLNIGSVAVFIISSLLFIFLGAYIGARCNPLNK